MAPQLINDDATMAKVLSIFGMRIKNRLHDLHKTQSWLAGELSVSNQAVTKWMQGASEPTFSNLTAMAKLLLCSVGYLAGDHSDESTAEVVRLMNGARPEDRKKILIGVIAVLGVAESESRSIKKASSYQ